MLLNKNDPDREGTYAIVDIHDNGAVDIRRVDVVQPINVHRLVPRF